MCAGFGGSPGILAGELLVAHRVDVELVAGDFFRLSAIGGLEVDDGQLVGVEPTNQVDPPSAPGTVSSLISSASTKSR